MIIPPYTIGNQENPSTAWGGLNTAVKDPRFLNRGQSPDHLNWITGRKGDHIELRRGQALLGTNRRAVSGNSTKVTGLGVGATYSGVQVPFFSAGRSIYHYDVTTDTTIEDNTVSIMPSAADGEDVNFNPYTNLAGSFMYVTSLDTPHYKIPVANPGDAVSQLVQTYRFGFAKINRSRMYGMNRKGALATSFDATGVYPSYVDRQTLAAFPTQQTNLNQFTGDGVTKTFSKPGVVGSIVSGAPFTFFAAILAGPINVGASVSAITQATNAQVTANGHGLVRGDYVLLQGVGGMTAINGIITTVSTVVDANNFIVPINSTGFGAYTSGGTAYKAEVFNDDRNGVMNSNLSGTGTFNYSTGAYTVTFNTAPTSGANAIMNISYEDATAQGILDFTYNTTTRVAGTGNSFRQDDGGGPGQAIWPYQGVEYCFHKLRSWVLNALDTTDTTTSNLPYYENIGVPYPRAVFPTGDGVIFLNNANPAQPRVSVLQIPPGSTNLTVVSTPLSTDLDLSGFAYDYCVIHRWGEYDIMGCQNYTNGVKDTYNSATFIRNIFSGIWNKLDFEFTSLAEYYGALIAGDSLSPNIYTLFSGFDDDGQVINNFWENAYTDFDLTGLKKFNYLNVQGLIQPQQKLEVYISLDQGSYVLYHTINGTDACVSKSNPVGVGNFTAGSTVVGGGDTIFANAFEIDIPIHSDLFQYVSFKLRAIDVGYVQVDGVSYKDIRFKRRRILSYEDPEIGG